MWRDFFTLFFFAFLLCVHVYGEPVKDTPYGQTLSHQKLFSTLPFDDITDAIYDPNGYCFVALSTNSEFTDLPLWSSKKRVLHSNVISTDDVYSDWRHVGISDDLRRQAKDVSFSKLVKTPDSILIVSPSVVVEIVLDFNCTKITSHRLLTDNAVSYGSVLSATYADVMTNNGIYPSLWLGTSEGLFWLYSTVAESGEAVWDVFCIGEIEEAVTSLLWVDKWGILFAGTNVALYELHFSNAAAEDLDVRKRNTAEVKGYPSFKSLSTLYQLKYEWIGGNLDFEVLGLSYDIVSDCVWAVQQEALHQRLADGTWWRHGHYQGIISNNITAMAVTEKSFDMDEASTSHFVWVGTINKGIMRRSVRGDHYNGDASQEDPWRQWLLFYGARYLPDGEVRDILSDDNNHDAQYKQNRLQQSTILIISKLGTTFLTLQQWQLEDKERVMQSYQYPRHDRHGIVAEVSLPVPGDTSQWSHNCEDSDGIWTAQYAVAAAMRYSFTNLEKDRTSAWKTFEGLEKLAQLSGIPGLIGRTFCSPEEINGLHSNGGTSGCGQDGENNWHDSKTFPGWVWKGDTSSDTIDGHYFAYGPLLDLVAKTEDEQARVYKCIDDITSYIVDNDLYYIDVDGEPTKWGRWNPADLNSNPDYYSERGLNSLEILAYLSLGYSVTGKGEFVVQFRSLTQNYGYYENALNQKIDNPFEDNHSDNELGHMAYHTLFYSLYRLQVAVEQNVLPYSINDLSELISRRDMLLDMTKPLLPSIKRWWSIVKHERSPLWLSVVAGAAQVGVSDHDKRQAVESLRLSAADLIGWSVHNSGRWDCVEQPYYGRDNPDNTLMRHIRPPQERILGHYNIDPFTLDTSHSATDAYSDGNGGGVEFSPAEWLLPYWSMRFYGLLSGSDF